MIATDAILENLLDALLVIDSNGCIIYTNRAAQLLFDKSADELKHQQFGFPVQLYEVQEIQLVKCGHLLTVQMLASHITWENEKVSLVSLRDITSLKKATEALEAKTRLLEQSNNDNAQFASLASHDLKEPVRKILIFSERLANLMRLNEEEAEVLEKIVNSANKMNRLIEGITDLAKTTHEKTQFKTVNLERIINEVCSDLQTQIDETGARVVIDDLPVIEADADKMYHLFLNLIGNSLKYCRKQVQPDICISGFATDDGQVKITCKDNGIGFDNALAKNMFQPFRRLHHRQYDGIGIGLAICQKIVELHSGEITADGKVGEGATFVICLPQIQSG